MATADAVKRAGRMVGWIAACAIAPALATAGGISQLNSLTWADTLVVALWLWQLSACLLAGPLVLAAIVYAWRGRPFRAADVAGVTLASGFGATFFARLEPAHQIFSVRPHVSIGGAWELSLIAAACAAVLVATWRMRGRARSVAIAAALVLGAGALEITAARIEPSRDRLRFVTRLAASVPNLARTTGARSRVLVIGIDGLDWKALEWLKRRGRLPTFASLIGRARFYQMDNRQMAISPQIWTAIYTGYPERDNMVGGFDEWQFEGMSRPIPFLPRFGAHPVWMLDVLLRHLDVLGGWTSRSSSTVRITRPTVWTIASDSDRRVGVFDPVP